MTAAAIAVRLSAHAWVQAWVGNALTGTQEARSQLLFVGWSTSAGHSYRPCRWHANNICAIRVGGRPQAEDHQCCTWPFIIVA